MKLKKILALVLALALAVTVLAACGSAPANNGTDNAKTDEGTTAKTDAESTESDLAYIKDKGEMVIGITLFEPMNYYEGDELVGFETEFSTAVCEKLGVTPKFQEIDWGSKEIELSSKNIDCIWNGLTITDERKENMAITEPYMNNRQVMIVKAENVDAYSQNVAGLSVIAEVDSTGYELIENDEFFANANATAVDSQAKALMDVAAGTSDVAVVDYVSSIGAIGEGTDYADLVVAPNEFPGDEYGVAFRKGSDVAEEVNKAMKELAADGTLATIAEKYGLQDLLMVE